MKEGIIMTCGNCKFGRRAENRDYVGCIKAIQSNSRVNHIEPSQLCDFYGKDSISTGWVNLNVYPEETTNGWGMIINFIPCFLKNDKCKHWEAR